MNILGKSKKKYQGDRTPVKISSPFVPPNHCKTGQTTTRVENGDPFSNAAQIDA
jgi:hypothetical protein